MWTRLRRWLTSLPIHDPIERRQALLVQVILLGLSGVLLFAALLTLIAYQFTTGAIAAGNLQAATSDILGLLLVMVPLILLRRGFFRVAVTILMIELFMLAFSTFYSSGLERGWLGVLEIALPISLAALVLGRRWSLVIYVASIIAVGITAFAWYPVEAIGTTVTSAIISFALIAGLLVLFLDRFGTIFRQSLAALRDSETSFRLLFANNPLPMWVCDAQTLAFVEINQAAIQHYGYSRAEFLQMHITDIYQPESQPAQTTNMNAEHRALQLSGPHRHRLKDARTIDVIGHAHTLEFAGRPAVLVVAEDITDRKVAEEALQQFTAQLEDRVQRRTADLASANTELRAEVAERQRVEAALRQAQAEAEAANQAKSEFLSRMSHELRTPMNAILGFAQVLELGELNPDERESVEHILKGGSHLLELINEVLDIARIEARRIPISIEPVALAEVCKEVLDLIAPLAASSDIKLPRLNSGEGRHVLADRQRLKQVLLNLLSNAIKYNRSGGRVTLTFEESTAHHLRIVVQDTGYGITPADLERLFTPFERLQADQHGVEGTGLGLVLSKGLVEAMGGSIGIESVLGAGSTFWIELPVADTSMQATAANENALATVAHNADMQPARTVLYVEDNLSNVKLIERLLARRSNVNLLTAMQARLGLDLAREHRPDLILLDLHLPDLSGLEVLRHLKGDPETASIPVVMLSADAMERQIERLMAAGAQAYLSKPLDIRKFLATMDQILSDRPA